MEKSQPEATHQDDALPLLPDDVPVIMPDLPLRLTISTEQHFKAISDRVRSRILGVIQYQPLTARQIAQRLNATSGAIGHHLRVLEEAGLVKVVARRIIRGIVASYYTRAARIFLYDLPDEISGISANMDVAATAHAEMLEVLASNEHDPVRCDGFPHVRVSLERALEYRQRLDQLINDLIDEPPDPSGQVYGVFLAMFLSPPYMQVPGNVEATPTSHDGEDE